MTQKVRFVLTKLQDLISLKDFKLEHYVYLRVYLQFSKHICIDLSKEVFTKSCTDFI